MTNNRPPDLSQNEWEQHVRNVLRMAACSGPLENIPSHALDHMRDVLLGKVVDERLARVKAELELLHAAHAAGAILSKTIVDEGSSGHTRRARRFDDIVNNAIAIIEGRS